MTIPFVPQFPAFISQPLLRQAPFDFALLRFLRLRSATLPSTSLCYASFDFALLRFLRLRSATLPSTSLCYASFDFATLRFLRLRYATLPSTSLRYASFDFATLRFLRLRYATLRTGSLPLIRGTAESRSPLRRGARGVQGIQRPHFHRLGRHQDCMLSKIARGLCMGSHPRIVRESST